MDCPPYLRRHNRLILLLMAMLIPVSLLAATGTALVGANVVFTFSLNNQSDMVFGDIASSNSTGTVVLSPAGSRLTTGGAFVSSTTAGGPAVFDVLGLPNAVYAITLPVSIVLTGAGGSNMVVDSFTSQPANSGLTDPGGQQSLFVGATLNLGSNQAVGSYSGLMSVTVVYN